jgi:hypothetical protein
MTGGDLARIRKKLGLSLYEWGRALGYQGNHNGIQVQVKDMETGKRTITRMCERLARMYERHGVPEEVLAD